MSVYNEGFVVDTEILFPGNFHLNLSEPLSQGGSAWIKIIIDIFNAKDDELR